MEDTSVVIPCYNAAPYVVAAVRSVQAQAPGLDIVVVDDGSSDGSTEILQRAVPQVRIIRQANQGVAVARNTGIANARGRWVAFLDADDIWLPGKLQAQYRLLQAHPDARMVYSAWCVWPSADPEPEPSYVANLSQEVEDPARWGGASGWIYPELLVDCVVWTSTVLVDKRLLEEAGAFNPELRVGEDYDLWLRLSRLTPILRVCKPGALYRIHPASITRRVPAKNYKAAVIESALQRWGYGSPDGRQAVVRSVHRGLARSWADFAGTQLVAGIPGEARRSATKALVLDPMSWLAWNVALRSLLPVGRRGP